MPTHNTTWITTAKSDKTNQGEINVHYPESNLDQKIKVYVTVIPRTTLSNVKNFFTDGSRYDKQPGSIKNGEGQGAILTTTNGSAIDYDAYTQTGTAGHLSTITKSGTSYTPTYSLSGLEYQAENNTPAYSLFRLLDDANGRLVSGPQTVTIHVFVPKGTIGKDI